MRLFGAEKPCSVNLKGSLFAEGSVKSVLTVENIGPGCGRSKWDVDGLCRRYFDVHNAVAFRVFDGQVMLLRGGVDDGYVYGHVRFQREVSGLKGLFHNLESDNGAVRFDGRL